MVEPEYKRAIRLTLNNRRLWLAGLLSALAFTEAWWILFGWGPERWGQRAANWVHGSRSIADAALFIIVAMLTFIALKAVGYLGEMVLIQQVGSRGEETPSFGPALEQSSGRYVPLVITLLPWDALRIAVIYLPAIFIALWDRWDPRYNHLVLYLLVLLGWFILLLAVYVLAGMLAMLAVRSSVLKGKGPQDAWREALGLLAMHPYRWFSIWLQAALADAIFLILAWPLSALVPWAVGQLAHNIGFGPLRSLIYFIEYAVLAAGFLIGQIGVQCYKSSLWTISFAGFREEVLAQEKADISGRRKLSFEPPPDFVPSPDEPPHPTTS